MVKEIVKAFNIPILEKSGFEADDVIGTVAKKAQEQGFTVYMMTPDKDFGQLVDERIYLYKPAYMGNAVDIMGIDEVKAKWGVERVDQVRDMLGLQGDASDNIPGIPGVGPKTAQKYIHTYGSVEELVAHAHELKGKQRENVEAFGDQGILSKELATISLDVPVTIDFQQMEYSGPDEAALRPIFEDLEFRTLIQRVFTSGTKQKIQAAPEESQLDLFASAPSKPTPAQVPDESAEEKPKEKIDFYSVRHFQQILKTKEEVRALVPFLLEQEEISFSFSKQGNSVDAIWDGMAICYQPDESFFILFPDNSDDRKALLGPLEPVLKDEKIKKIGHDWKADLLFFLKEQIPITGPFQDTMLAGSDIREYARILPFRRKGKSIRRPTLCPCTSGMRKSRNHPATP
jgi:DNA polymerase-1